MWHNLFNKNTNNKTTHAEDTDKSEIKSFRIKVIPSLNQRQQVNGWSKKRMSMLHWILDKIKGYKEQEKIYNICDNHFFKQFHSLSDLKKRMENNEKKKK